MMNRLSHNIYTNVRGGKLGALERSRVLELEDCADQDEVSTH